MQSERTERVETFAATRLHVSDIVGTVQVRELGGVTVAVRITGSKGRVERIRCEPCGDVLHISDPDRDRGATIIADSAGGTKTHVFGGGSGVSVTTVSSDVHCAGAGVVVSTSRVISGEGEVADIASDRRDVEIVVDAPPHSPITIDGASGRYRIGDLGGRLDVRLTGISDLSAGRVAGSYVEIGDASRADIVAVSGRELRARITGTGQLTVREGQVDELIVSVSDAGRAVFGGVAARADLSVSGMGRIRVNQVTQSLVDRQVGLGRVSVHVPPRRDPGSFWT